MSAIRTTLRRTLAAQTRSAVPVSRVITARRTLASVTPAPIRDGPALSQTNRMFSKSYGRLLTTTGAEVTLRRFWKTVGIKQNEQGELGQRDYSGYTDL
jgi:hypothetical protein